MTTPASASAGSPPRSIGRYALFGEIASGGMATVHYGRLVGPAGFSRLVAIKRLLPQFAKDSEFVAMFLDEARLASRIQHPNVVSTLDVVTVQDEIFLVMDYVQGETLSRLIRNATHQHETLPPGHVVTVMTGALHGLHAAHEAKSERREPLNIVHRDVSPQNIMVGVDGVARVLDFGVAKAAMRSQSTRDGVAKGKLSYMSPEQLNGKDVDRRTDVFAAGIVLWEALCARRLFAGNDAGDVFSRILSREIPEPKSVVPELSEELNWVTMRALERDPTKRFQTAREFAIELEGAFDLSTPREVGEWVQRLGGEALEKRDKMVADVESASTDVTEFRETNRSARDSEGPTLMRPIEGLQSDTDGISSPSGVGPRPSERSAVRLASAITGASDAPVAASGTSGVAALPALPREPKRSSAVWPLLLLACLGGGGLAYFMVQKPKTVETTSVESRTPIASVAQPPATVTTPPLDPATLPTASAEALPAEPNEVGEDGAESQAASERIPDGVKKAPSRTRASARTAKAIAPPAQKAASKQVNCNPPWFVDASGIRRLKPECL